MSLNRYSPWALVFGGTTDVAVPFQPQSLEMGNDPTIADMVGGGRQAPNVRHVVKKRPFCRFDTTDLSLVSPLTWTPYGAGLDITSVSVYYRRRIENAQWDSVYKSFVSSSGIIIPISIQGDMTSPAVASVLILPHMSSGSAWTYGTASDARASVTKAFYPYSLALGTSLAQLAIRSFSWQLQIEPDDDDQFEPAHYLYEDLVQTFRATTKDAAQVTEARLEDGATEACTAVWRNRNDTGETISQALGDNTFVRATISGRDTMIEGMTTDNA